MSRRGPIRSTWVTLVGVPATDGSDHFRSLFQEDSMAEKNRKKTYLILIVILLVVILIAYL